jgi:hypothetical protein
MKNSLLKILIIPCIIILLLVSCSNKPTIIDQLEEDGYTLELQDTSYCDVGIMKHYIIYNDLDENLGYIYEFDGSTNLETFRSDNEGTEDNQVFGLFILFAEEEIINLLNEE